MSNAAIQRQRLTPAALVIARFGGVREVARQLGVFPSTISRWQADYPAGTGGSVPNARHADLLRRAKAAGVRLTKDELLMGGYE